MERPLRRQQVENIMDYPDRRIAKPPPRVVRLYAIAALSNWREVDGGILS